MVLIASGWGRRPQRPDRVEFNPDKDYLERWETIGGRNELEAIAYWLLRDDLDTVDEETGKKKGLRGKDPILFEEHIFQRRRREILNINGVPDPAIQAGVYWRPHQNGRTVNSEQARKAGSGYYR